MIEPLESRIAPAAFVTYTDIDGDLVRITTSAGPLDLNDLTIVGTIAGGQLRSLNITDAGFAGANIIFTVTQKPGGDGLAHVGSINATGVDLGNVTVKGDLGAIDVGDTNFATPALKTLCARSMGSFGTATLGGDLQSDIRGSVGALKITGDVVGVDLNVTDGGGIGAINIGGSLVGGAADYTGAIVVVGNIGPVKIGGDVVGGAGCFSGIVQATSGKVGAVNIGGSIRGGSNTSSGLIYSFTTMGAVVIGDDILGGSGLQSGAIIANGNLPSVTLGGSLLAQPGNAGGASSALIFSGGTLGLVKIAHNVRCGAGNDSGYINANGALTTVQIGGTVLGAAGQQSGAIHSYTELGTVTIGGDIRGGDSSESAYLKADRIGSVLIGGSIVAGIDQDSLSDLVHNASIRAGHDIGTITVRGSILGHESANGVVRPVISALGQRPENVGLLSDLAVRSLVVVGRVLFTDVLAGFGPDEAPSAGSNGNASIHTVRVGGDWIASSISAGIRDAAGDGFANGDDYVISDAADAIVARIASITIGGAVIGTRTNPNDHSGFTAQQIGSFRAGLYLAPLTAATDPLIPLALLTGDVSIREV